MSITAQIVDQRVRKLEQDYREHLVRQDPSSSGDEHKRISKAFVGLCLATALDISLDEAFDALTDGGHDLAIDALYVGEVRDFEFVVTLAQGKYYKELGAKKAFPTNEITKMINTVRVLFDPSVEYKANRLLTARVEEIRSLISDGNLPHVSVLLCSNGVQWDENGQQQIDSSGLPEEQVDWGYFDHERLIEAMSKQKKITAKLQFVGASTVEAFSYRRVAVGKVRVADIADLFSTHGPRLLERNVRRYLGGTNRVNRDIARTLRVPAERENFYFFNNGITLVCDKFRHNGFGTQDVSFQIEGLQVVNGGQTCVTIERTLRGLKDADLSAAHVLVRLYELDSDGERAVVDRITLATNSQSPVELRDLKANDEVQQRLEVGLEDLGYTYLRKRGQESGPRTISMEEAAEAVMAVWRKKPHVARFQRSKLFGAYYREIFSSMLSPAQVAVAAEVVERVKSSVDRADDTAPRFLPYATHMLAMRVGALVLGDLKLGDLNHLNVGGVLERVVSHTEAFLGLAIAEVEMALDNLGVDEGSLQRLSGAFRSGSLGAAVEEAPHLLRARIDEYFASVVANVTGNQRDHEIEQVAERYAEAMSSGLRSKLAAYEAAKARVDGISA